VNVGCLQAQQPSSFYRKGQTRTTNASSATGTRLRARARVPRARVALLHRAAARARARALRIPAWWQHTAGVDEQTTRRCDAATHDAARQRLARTFACAAP
jgi:hypothetical protein